MPTGIVVATIYIGMVASDLGLYVIGLGARHLPWLNRLAVTDRVRNFGDTLQRNLFGLAALGRVVPGAIFVIMTACGWTRVRWTRVALASMFSSALYLPLMLYLVILFGDALDDRVGLWTWPFLLGLIVALAFMRYRVFSFSETPAALPATSPNASRGPGLAFARRQVLDSWPEFRQFRTSTRTRWLQPH
jgi:membrane protein DedA with SNARE-associated domain